MDLHQPQNNFKAQLDYILINKKWKNSAGNWKVYSSFKGEILESSQQIFAWFYAGMKYKQ